MNAKNKIFEVGNQELARRMLVFEMCPHELDLLSYADTPNCINTNKKVCESCWVHALTLKYEPTHDKNNEIEIAMATKTIKEYSPSTDISWSQMRNALIVIMNDYERLKNNF